MPLPDGTPFPVENLPLGAFRRAGDAEPHLGIAIGDHVLDLHAAASRGLFDDALPEARGALAAASWNEIFGGGRALVRRVRERAAALLAPESHAVAADSALLAARGSVNMVLPIAPGDYVDFYASVAHASRVAAIFRPGDPPLPPQYRHLPIGYHGRASSIVRSGSPIVRPRGQVLRGGEVSVGPSEMLDYECEIAYVTTGGPELGTPIPIREARDRIVGAIVLNDWSARDIQSWEYRPLGPFLGKSFATSLGDWIVTLDALEPYRVDGPPQDPEPASYLREDEPRAVGACCEILLSTTETRARGFEEFVLARPSARELYWSPAQMLAHLTSNGARIRAGDLFATGTISSEDGGFEPGSMLELTRGGAEPFVRDFGGVLVERTFLEDGDEIVLRAICDGAGGAPAIGFGDVRGRIEPARG